MTLVADCADVLHIPRANLFSPAAAVCGLDRLPESLWLPLLVLLVGQCQPCQKKEEGAEAQLIPPVCPLIDLWESSRQSVLQHTPQSCSGAPEGHLNGVKVIEISELRVKVVYYRQERRWGHTLSKE